MNPNSTTVTEMNESQKPFLNHSVFSVQGDLLKLRLSATLHISLTFSSKSTIESKDISLIVLFAKDSTLSLFQPIQITKGLPLILYTD